ncbi:MarR family winged helix-turn-helix transcriptional regulator [Pseudonocardia sp. CA-142604]|uniref:MarR family winged helix-turn-helix transcriptional regulator n=1 Tax=Pseudonocardia sp. CA-142604 TaxID=3240024 RepID=UPI003D91F661
MAEPRWLDEQERHSWLSFLVMHAKLTAELHRQLRADHGLSLADFDVLAQLTEAPEGTVRALELGRSLQWEKSRLSHHLKRMEQRGLIRREDCLEDSRGAMVVATDLGRQTIEQAAPGHVETVRDLVFDQLTKREVETLGRIADKVLARLPQTKPSRRRSS